MSRGEWLKNIGNAMLDLVYPPGLYCISCGKITDDSRTYRLCNDCMRSMNWITPRHCAKCGRPLAETDPGSLCFGCSRREANGSSYSFDKGYACAGYGAVEQAVIFDFKYGGRSDIGDVLGEILYDRMVSEYGADKLPAMYGLVVPVPTHRERKLRRGFNHAGLMAESFAKRAGLRCDPELMLRIKATAPMKGLGPEERTANIRGAFTVRNSRIQQLENASVLLIDDIFTTGATIDEAAKVLKQYGASRVDFLAFAGGADIIRG